MKLIDPVAFRVVAIISEAHSHSKLYTQSHFSSIRHMRGQDPISSIPKYSLRFSQPTVDSRNNCIQNTPPWKETLLNENKSYNLAIVLGKILMRLIETGHTKISAHE